MAGPRFSERGAFTRWLVAGLAGLLAGCAAPPAPPVLTAAPADAMTATVPAAAASMDTAMPANLPVVPQPGVALQPTLLADFIARRLRKPVESLLPAPAPASAPAPDSVAVADGEIPVVPSAAVDDKYQLTGAAARELERGRASWYGGQFHGRRTASGENYDKYALTAAHKTLPFGTIVRVRSLILGREVDVRINDRGPFAPGRVIDVSQAAAEALGLMSAGVAEVSLKVAESLKDAPQQASRSRSKAPRRAPVRPAEAYRH